jgi:hypothetical protein
MIEAESAGAPAMIEAASAGVPAKVEAGSQGPLWLRLRPPLSTVSEQGVVRICEAHSIREHPHGTIRFASDLRGGQTGKSPRLHL